MNVLLISRPGVPLLRTLRESETAWDAIRFYEPQGLSIGVYIPVSTIAGALSLASDLRYFLRKYTAEHLFQIRPGVYYTAALTRSRYLSRDLEVSDDWQYRLIYWVESMGPIIRCKIDEWKSEEVLYTPWSCENCQTRDPDNADQEEPYPGSLPIEGVSSEHHDDGTCGGYILEVWCTKPEFDIV